MSVRLARREDVPAILDISNHYALTTPANFAIEPEPLETWLADWDRTHETHPWLVAEDSGGSIVGFAKASPWKGRCAYAFAVETTVYVHPHHHRGGIGRRLYDRLFEIIEAQGYRVALAGITLPNDASVALHEKMGMRRVATLEGVGWKFDRWHDVAYWEKQFGDGPPAPIRPVQSGGNS